MGLYVHIVHCTVLIQTVYKVYKKYMLPFLNQEVYNCTRCTSCVHIVHDCKSKFLNFGLCYVQFRLSTMHFHRFSGFYFCFSLKSKSKTDINIELHRIINDYFEFHSRIVESISESKYSTLLRKSYQILCYGNLSRFLSPRFLSQATCALN